MKKYASDKSLEGARSPEFQSSSGVVDRNAVISIPEVSKESVVCLGTTY